MFKITPIQEKEKQAKICALCGADYRPDAFAYQMYDLESGEIMGMSQFEIGEIGYIYDIKEAPNKDDFEAMFILARQTMNFIDSCDVHVCRAYEGCADSDFLKAVGFNDQLLCDMTGMFDGNCGCK